MFFVIFTIDSLTNMPFINFTKHILLDHSINPLFCHLSKDFRQNGVSNRVDDDLPLSPQPVIKLIVLRPILSLIGHTSSEIITDHLYRILIGNNRHSMLKFSIIPVLKVMLVPSFVVKPRLRITLLLPAIYNRAFLSRIIFYRLKKFSRRKLGHIVEKSPYWNPSLLAKSKHHRLVPHH